MTQLTKEHFDAQLKKLATKEDLKAEIAQLAGMVQRGFQEMSRKLDVREDVDKLKHQMRQVRQSIGLRN